MSSLGSLSYSSFVGRSAISCLYVSLTSFGRFNGVSGIGKSITSVLKVWSSIPYLFLRGLKSNFKISFSPMFEPLAVWTSSSSYVVGFVVKSSQPYDSPSVAAVSYITINSCFSPLLFLIDIFSIARSGFAVCFQLVFVF